MAEVVILLALVCVFAYRHLPNSTGISIHFKGGEQKPEIVLPTPR